MTQIALEEAHEQKFINFLFVLFYVLEGSIERLWETLVFLSCQDLTFVLGSFPVKIWKKALGIVWNLL